MQTKSNESFYQALCVSSVQACVSGVATAVLLLAASAHVSELCTGPCASFALRQGWCPSILTFPPQLSL